jgi:hypothetical protein
MRRTNPTAEMAAHWTVSGLRLQRSASYRSYSRAFPLGGAGGLERSTSLPAKALSRRRRIFDVAIALHVDRHSHGHAPAFRWARDD